MTWALSLGEGRPRPAAIVALSGFMPRVDGFSISLEGLEGYPVAIAHGSLDPVISVEWSREARGLLEEAGADVLYRESPLPHTVDPRVLPELQELVARVLTGSDPVKKM
jgi:phospholipase/carboxylesterase